MRTLRVFLAHELATQMRSARFHGITLAYLVVTIAPAVGSYILARRAIELVTAALYGAMLDTIQPLATTIFAAALAIDAIARERDENSLGVVAMAPISAAGYVLNRWLALVALILPVTLIPRIAAIALLAQGGHRVPDPAPILLGWLLHVAPLLFVVSALATALGTITNRVVLALLCGLGLFTVGLGIANDLLANAGRQIAGPGDFFGLVSIQPLLWFFHGYAPFYTPSDAGYALARELDALVIQGALAASIAIFFLAVSCAYLRRTKRDLRPWRISETHQLRSFLRTVNRFREELSPDGGLEIPERIAIAIGVIAPIAALVMITHRYNAFERLAAERFESITSGAAPMPIAIVPAAASLRGSITKSGVLDATATLTMRNDGNAPQRELAFMLNRGIVIERLTASRGTARQHRFWERLGVVLDPPLAPRESRSITFKMHGAPGSYDFEMPYGKNFDEKWRRYRSGKASIELADLSRSIVRRDATAERMFLYGLRLVPVPRYSPWTVEDESWWSWRLGERPNDAFVAEAIHPQTDFSVDLKIPDGFTAIDVCGSVATRRLSSRCTFGLADYVLVGARFETMPLANGVRLAYLPSHAQLARMHAPSLAAAIATAKQALPSFSMNPRAVFVERPRWPYESYNEWNPMDTLRSVNTAGALNVVPEPLFTRLKPLNRNLLASSLITSHLLSRRRVVPEERGFFAGFYETIATWRTGGSKPSAVEPPVGAKPLVDPIIREGAGGWRGPMRLRKVLVDIEYRVGSERLLAGVEDFLAAGPSEGTAKELLDSIGRRGGISLDRYYTDYFLGRELPRLTLKDVTFTHGDAGWDVRGSLANEAGGEVFCPLVLRTASGAVRTTLRVDAKSATPFVLHSLQTPRVLQLDPEHVVYRHAAVGTVESVDYKEAK